MRLTKRQLAIAKLVAYGYKSKEIAEELNIHEQIIKNNIKDIYDELGFHNRVELAMWYVRYVEFGR